MNTPIESVFPFPPKDLFNSEDDELTEPIDEGLASLELQDTIPSELDEYLMAQLVGKEQSLNKNWIWTIIQLGNRILTHN
jgi:hypothetical protein